MTGLFGLILALAVQDAPVDLKFKFPKDKKLSYRHTVTIEQVGVDTPKTEIDTVFDLVAGETTGEGTAFALTLQKSLAGIPGLSDALDRLTGKAFSLLVDSRGAVLKSDSAKILKAMAAGADGQEKRYLEQLALQAPLIPVIPFAASLGVVLPGKAVAPGTRWETPQRRTQAACTYQVSGVKDGDARILISMDLRPETTQDDLWISGSGAACFSVERGAVMSVTRTMLVKGVPGALSPHVRIRTTLALLDPEGRPQRPLPALTDRENVELMEEGKLNRCARNLQELWKLQGMWSQLFGGRRKLLPRTTGREFWLALARSEPPLLELQTEPDETICCTADPGADLRTYRGPKQDVNTLDPEAIVGCCPAGKHKDGSIVVLRKSGAVIRVGDPKAVEKALEETLPGDPPKK